MSDEDDVTVPKDLSAERSLLGALMLSRQAIEDVASMVGAEDFYHPAHRLIFSAALRLFNTGSSVDAILVATELDKDNVLERCGGMGRLIELQADCPSTSNAAGYAKVVLDRSNARRLIAECEAAIDSAIDLEDPEAVRDKLGTSLEVISTPMAETDALIGIEEFMRRYESEDREEAWIVDNLLKTGWRCVVVAAEGGGKTTLFRQFALAAAQGVQPFSMNPLRVGKVPTLIVDCENPDDSIYEVCQPITARLERWFESSRSVGGYEEEMAWLYHKPGGINLRNRVDLARLDAVLAATQPKLVCAGPLYKMYDESAGDTTHTAMKATLAALDKLRTRHGFALMLEHHAPHGHGSSREMRPEGSSLLMRWPELGLGMTPHSDRGQQSNTIVKLTRWRKDRTRNAWPEWLRREQELTEERMPWRETQEPKKNNDFTGYGEGYTD